MQRSLSLTLLLVAAIGQIISMSPLSVPSFSPMEAEAQQQGDVLIERGHAHAIYDLGNGNYTTAFGLPPWVLDESTGEYVPHIVNDLGNNTVEVQSGRIGWIIGSNEAQIYDPDLKEHRATERWLPSVDSTVLDKFFQGQTVATNSTGAYVTNTYSAQVEQRTVTLEIIYAIPDGEPAQRIVKVTGLPRNFASTLVLEREWVAMNAAEIRDETGSETLTADSRTLSGLDGTIRGIRFTDANGELLVHENLVTAGDKLKSIDYSSNRAIFKYSGWTDSDILLVDDTFTSGSPTIDGFVFTDNTSGTACSTIASDINDNHSALLLLVSDSSSSSNCRRAFAEWDITAISNDATISNVVFKFEVDGDSGARNCTYTPIATQPSSLPTAQTLWDDIGDGTPYVSDNSTCTTVGTNKSVDLGSSADSAVQSALTSDWWAIGIKIHNEVRDGSSHNVSLVSEDGLGTPTPTLEVTYTVPVTQPITITVDNSGTQSTFTLSGCSVSPTTIATDGVAHNFTADPSCTITITVSSDQANTRYRFSGGSTTTTVNTCASGTCSGSSKTVYFELQNTYQASTNGQGPPTWDSGLSAAVTGTVAGAGSTTICTINPSSGTTTTASCSGWTDNNTQASLPSTLSGAGANIRWLGSGTLAWTDTTGGNTHTGAYYKQIQNTYQVAPAGNRATFNAAMTFNIIGFHLGSSGQIITGINTSSGGGTASSNAWTDYNREAKLDQTEVLSATERWMSLTQPSWTQTTGGNTNTGNYYNQFQPNITASGISVSVTTVTVTRTQFNISGNTDIAGSTATGVWADYNTVISIENPVSISSTERWFAGDDATVSWTQTDATNRVSDSYTRQWEKDVTLSGLQTVNATRTFLGTAGPEPVSTGEDYYLDLDGSDDYVRLTQNATFSGEWHYATWFNRDDSGGFHTFIGKDYGVAAGVKIGLCGAGACGAGNDNKLFVRLVDGGSTSIIDIGYTTSDNDRWNFMSVGRDGSNNVKASLNGDSYVTGSTLSGSFTINSIGRSFAGGQFFKGSLGDQKLYDAFLSQTDTDRLANGAAVTQNLVNHWKFNEGTGTTTVDAVGTNDGTLTSGPTWTLGLWIDHNTSLTFPDPVSISSTERWDTDSTVSYTPTDATGITLSYTKQWGPNITASGISASVTTVTVTRTQLGSQGTEDIAGSTATQIWADDNTVISIENPVSISASERWFAGDSATVSWTQTDATNRVSDSYTRQWQKDVTLSGSLSTVNATRTFLGVEGPEFVSTGDDYHLSFDGVDDYVQVVHDASIDFGSNDSFSIYVSFKSTTERDQSLLEKWSGGGPSYPYVIRGPKVLGGIQFAIYDGTNNPTVTTGLDVADGKWHKIIAVRDVANDELRIYLDGSLRDTSTDTTTGSISNTQDLIIGARHPTTFASGGKHCDCDIGQVMMFSGAFDDTEAKRLSKGADITDDLISHWKFDDGSGITATDSVGTNNGTLNNSPTWTQGLWVDHSTNLSFPDPITISANESYDTNDTVSYSVTDATGITLSYHTDWSYGMSDTVTVTDAVVRTYFAARPMAETLATSESINRKLTASRSKNDTVTIADSLGAVHTEAVEQPITLSAGTGSPTFEAQGVFATITCEYGGTHDGDPAQQEFQCFESETVTVSLPAGNATERWVWSDGTATDRQFTACETGTCVDVAFTYYLQEKQIITLDGLDAVRSASITRTQEGSTGTTAASGSTTTEIWADYGTTFTIPTTVTIVSEENRFQSYDSASELSYNVTSTNTKTITYQHEFNMLFRVHEEHLGVIFIPMPPALFTGTITTSNSTALNLTFDTQVTDDHLQPSEGRYWVKNGTTTWTDITWRDLVVNATGSQSITAYGNFDIESASKHHGYEGNRHFRVAVDGGTIDEDSSTFDADASTFEFEATATGTKIAKVEFLTTIYGGVADIHVNGTSFDSANWNVQDLGDDLTGVVTINNLSFSTNIIKVFFTGYGSGSSPSGGGGGGASAGSFVPIPSFENPFDGLLPSADVKVTVPTYNVPPGGSQTQNILIEWDASTVAIIQQIEFAAHPEWFQVGATLPMKVTLMPGEDKLRAQIPLTVFLPEDVQGVEQIVDMRVTTAIGATSVTEVKPVRVVLASTSMLAYLGLGTLIVAGTVGVALQARRRGSGRRIRVRRR